MNGTEAPRLLEVSNLALFPSFSCLPADHVLLLPCWSLSSFPSSTLRRLLSPRSRSRSPPLRVVGRERCGPSQRSLSLGFALYLRRRAPFSSSRLHSRFPLLASRSLPLAPSGPKTNSLFSLSMMSSPTSRSSPSYLPPPSAASSLAHLSTARR